VVGAGSSAGGDAVFGVRGFCYTAADGPLPNIAMEAIREGIDDMRYLYTLTQAVLDARNAGRTAEADAVVGEINSILSGIPVDSAQVRTYCDGISADSLHAARWRLALALMRISQKE
jgi:hypothetical protein